MKAQEFFLQKLAFCLALDKNKKIVKTGIFILSSILNILIFSNSFANPTGGSVQSGNATITQPESSTLQVNQTSQKVIIHWDTFNIQNNEHTHFQQPVGGVALNRVNPAQGVSTIYGQLSATGKLILINPDGIFFGPQAFVNVGGLIATTGNISNENFLQNNYTFNGASSGKVSNLGRIIAQDHGLIALIGGEVENHGLIEANLGNVILGSAQEYTISFGNNDLVHFAIQKPASTSHIKNSGTIMANSGTVLLAASSAQSVLDQTINMNGIVQANSVGQQGGEIILAGGSIKLDGKLLAKSKENEKAGNIRVFAKQLTLTDTALLDVSGETNAGNIVLGNKLYDINLGPVNEQTFIAKSAALLANTNTFGNGGAITVWSNGTTYFYGNIEARGGSVGGNGGFVEVSGKNNLQFNGFVDTSALHGKLGTLILDPKFLIVKETGDGYSAGINNQFNNDASNINVISPTSLIAAGANSNLILQANSDVIFTDALHLTGTGSLTVQAGRSILINNDISTNNTAINMTANDASALASERSIDNTGNPMNDNETMNANILMAPTSTLNAGTGNISLTIADFSTHPFYPGSIVLGKLTGQNIDVTSANAITVNKPLVADTIRLLAKNSVLTLNDTLTANGANYALVLAGTAFINNIGADVLNTPSGNYLVWSGSPYNDVRNNIPYQFKQYNARYGQSNLLGTGNGFLYSIAPTITPILTGTINKVYDATTSANIAPSNYAYNGILDNDQAIFTQPTSGEFDTKNAGINKNVTAEGIELLSVTNNGAAIYGYQVLSTATGNIGVITPATVNAELTNITSKVYDTNTSANLAAFNYRLQGVLGNDTVSLNNPAHGQYDTANVGSNKMVTVESLGLIGSDATNYRLASETVSAPIGIILPAPLSTALTGTVSKVYDTTTQATLTANNYVLNGVLGNDQVILNNPVTGQYDTANVGTDKLVSVTGLNISGSASSNYHLVATDVSGNIGIITPAPLTASLTGIVSKVYDATTSATLAANNYVLNGVIGQDQVTLNKPVNGQYDTPNVGTDKLVSVTGLNISGSAASNYHLVTTDVSGNIGTITAAPIEPPITPVTPPTNPTTTTNSGNTTTTTPVVPPNTVLPTSTIVPPTTINSVSIENRIPDTISQTISQTALNNTQLFDTQARALGQYRLIETYSFAQWYTARTYLKEMLAALLALTTSGLLIFAYKRRSKELTDLSFKLRTALETILGFSNLLYHEKVGKVSQQQREFLQDIMAGSKGILGVLAKVELYNVFTPTEKMAFNLRTALQDIIGFSSFLALDSKKLSAEQQELIRGITTGSKDILQLIPARS